MASEHLASPRTHERVVFPAALVTLAFAVAYLSGAQTQEAFGKTAEDVLQGISIFIASCGVLVRLYVAGSDTSSLRAGPYSAMRHPKLLGDLMIVLGVALGTYVWWFSLVALAGFAFYYARAASREDSRLRALHGERHAAWTARTPAFLPSARLWRNAETPFDWKTAFRAEFGALYFVVAYSVLMEIGIDLRTGHATTDAWPADWAYYLGALAIVSLLGLCLLVLAQPARLRTAVATPDLIGEGIPQTRGLRVDGRAGLVDTLENLISGGQQEAILQATLRAARVCKGDHLLDIGCGTGKLVIAAARQAGRAGSATGIDATPAMIELAGKRAREHSSDARFRVGVAEALPFADASLDAVTSSYFFHHLPSDVKAEALREMWRVLKPGGRLVITDYGKPRSLLGYAASIPMRFDFHEYVRPQLNGELDRLVREAGLGEPEILESFLGYIGVLRLVKGA